jgi:hypothetical protein
MSNNTDDTIYITAADVEQDYLKLLGNISVSAGGTYSTLGVTATGAYNNYSYSNYNDYHLNTSSILDNSPAILSTVNNSGTLSLKGKDADIDINGISLKDFMQQIEQRLALLKPDTRLEAEWEELRALGDQYRKLEQEINARMKTFDILKNE